MKKAFYIVITLLVCVFAFVSCRKEYHCECSFNNQVMLNKDLGNQSKSDAQSLCNKYDTTVTGETWSCNVY